MTGVVFALGLVLAVVVGYLLLARSDRAQSRVACALSAAYDLNFRCAYGRIQLNRCASLLLRMFDAVSAAGVMSWLSKFLSLRA